VAQDGAGSRGVGALEDARIGPADAHREGPHTDLACAGPWHGPRSERETADALESDARLLPVGHGRVRADGHGPVPRARIIPYIISW
jgi:hypothetical protein